MDAVAFGEDVRLHLRIPALGLVSEVDACFEQRLQRYARWLSQNTRDVLHDSSTLHVELPRSSSRGGTEQTPAHPSQSERVTHCGAARKLRRLKL